MSSSNYSFTLGLPGILVPQHSNFAGSITALGVTAANQGRLFRFVLSEPLALALVAFEVTTLDATDPDIDVAIYDATLTTRIASTGPTAGKATSTGVKSMALTANLAAGVAYWAGLSCETTTAQFRGIASNSVALLLGNTVTTSVAASSSGVGTWPASSPTVTFGSGLMPLLALRSS